ncbi:ATP-dependent transcriptional regulator [Roseovarius sp. 22II1-1F6A]|nr:ATP-dependent transcriptional regulator [Roseovarius sp. 22II1-1F6A]
MSLISRLSPALLAVSLLSACAAPVSEMPERRSAPAAALPPMKTFGAHPTVRPRRSNAALAADFMELSFRMESGRELPTFTRFEGPVSVRVLGNAGNLNADLSQLLGRLRREAGISVTRVDANQQANVTIEVISRAELQRSVPQAACFVVPRVSSWADFRRARRSRAVDWTTLRQREQVAIFLPGDVSPQEIRDCLHEELAQALGPLNDLYRLPDSVFNDDNFHTVLTGFDMLMLRAYYDPSLRSGMTPQEVAARLPAILDRINPAGRGGRSAMPDDTPRAWVDAIETALGPRGSDASRRAAARRAVEIAGARGWQDTRRGFSLYALGRLSLSESPEAALAAFLGAAQVYGNSYDTRIQAAHVNMQLAAFALSNGQPEATLAFVNDSLQVVMDSENAALLASLLMLKSEALEDLGRPSEARMVRLDSLGWARYGFGRDQVVRARQSEIAALSPRLLRER